MNYLQLLICTFFINMYSPTAESISTNYQQKNAETQICGFYKKYMSNLFDFNCLPDVFTKEMYAKYDRVCKDTDVNPILRAQDFNELALKTLNCKRLDENWYMVNFFYKEKEAMNIPVKAHYEDNVFKIVYIVPYWGGENWGDDMFDLPKVDISQDSALLFVESFYRSYVYQYATLSPTLNQDIADLRTKYLTPAAIAEYNAQAEVYMYDYMDGYDALIGGFDFDALWYPSLSVSKTDQDNVFILSFNITKTNQRTIKIQVAKVDGMYKIVKVG